MTNQPNDTAALEALADPIDTRGYALLTATAQQAVLPRKLDEGIYATLGADGGIVIEETYGYTQKRKHDWDQAHSDRPEFIHRAVTLLDVASFIDYLDRNTTDSGDGVFRHGEGALELWANIDARNITAILDGHTGLRKHTATLALKVSREWSEWSAIDGKLLDQTTFAQFIEDHLSTIAEPSGAILVDVCETLTGKTNVNWRSQTLGKNGQRQFVFEETVEAKAGQKGDLAVPTELTLVVRPFQGSDPIAIKARFRYRLHEGRLTIGVKLAEPERVLEDAFNVIVDDVQASVPVHVNHGRP